MRVLLVKLSSFGDVIHALPALTDAKAALPDLEIDWLVDAAFAGVASLESAGKKPGELLRGLVEWPNREMRDICVLLDAYMGLPARQVPGGLCLITAWRQVEPVCVRRVRA